MLSTVPSNTQKIIVLSSGESKKYNKCSAGGRSRWRKSNIDSTMHTQEHPNLMVEAVKAMKARCKDKNEKVQIISLDLLDQCMQSNGIQLQLHV